MPPVTDPSSENVGQSYSSNPHTLTGTTVTETSTAILSWYSRVARCAIDQYNELELWYYRDATWSKFPIQPVMGGADAPTLKVGYHSPTMLEFSLQDGLGLLAPSNLESSYNYNGALAEDPLLDSARRILARLGVRCWDNLASGLTPTFTGTGTLTGALTQVTDETLVDWTVANPTGFCSVDMPSSNYFDINVDLGSSQFLRNFGIRFGTKKDSNEEWTLPASVQILTSSDNVNWKSWVVRPVGGLGSVSLETGDWDEHPGGRAIEVHLCDYDVFARYVKFRVTSTGANKVAFDQIGIFGSNTYQLLGQNIFVGYLGGKIDFSPDGMIHCEAMDNWKKCSDNNSIRLTPAFEYTELADIAHSLMTGATFWKAQSAYNTAFGSGDVGWSTGVARTGFTWPLWQSQSNSITGYVRELFSTIGWEVYWDGNGVLQCFEPPYRQRLPSRVFIAGHDGNNDVRHCVRSYTDQDMRNTVEINTGKVESGNAGVFKLSEPASTQRYGERLTPITDPILSTDAIRVRAAQYFLRDYAWRLERLSCNIQPDFNIRIRDVHAFRAPARPALFAKSGTVTGDKRKGKLWSLMGLVHYISTGDWHADAEYIPYYAWTSDPPEFLSLTPLIAPDTDKMTAAWTAITDPDVSAIRVYYSSTSSTAGFTQWGSDLAPTVTSTNLTGLTPGQRYWVYLTTVDYRGVESLPSQIRSAIAGGTASVSSGWTVSDLAVTLLKKEGPDADGYYTYTFYATWTSPNDGVAGVDAEMEGFKRMRIMAHPLASPSSDEEWGSWQWGPDEWSWYGDYIDPGMGWDRVTPGSLDWYLRFRTTTNFTSTQRIYFRMWTSSATSRWRRWGGDNDPGWPGNITYYQFA